MGKKIAAIIFIFFCTGIAWVILGASIGMRTSATDTQLGKEVTQLWGDIQYQYPPDFTYSYLEYQDRVDEKTKKLTREKVLMQESLPIEKSDVTADFSLDYRKKGLLWYSTYLVKFDGTYRVINDTPKDETIDITHKFPTANAEYDDFHIFVDGKEIERLTWSSGDGITTEVKLAAGKEVDFRVVYTSRGLSEWHYYFSGGAVEEVRDFSLKITTDFTGLDFPAGTLSPTAKETTPSGMLLAWKFTKRITGNHIGIVMPERVNPGPMAERMTFFAPVSLLFFFFIVFIITTLRGINLHPMNYFFLAAAFFAFHLLMAYLVDHLDIHLSFLISAAVSLFLVVSYLRLVTGMRLLIEAGTAQLIYLVLFSYSFFFKGYTGLIITVASIITLFVVMQMTGRIGWEEKFRSISEKKDG